MYPDRGLFTKNGKIYKLFEQLYTVITFTLNAIGISLSFVGNILYKGDEGIFTLICLNCKNRIKSGKYSVKLIKITLCYSASLCVISSIVFYTVKKYVRSNTNTSKNIPIKFGKYQRNVVTFNQTMIFGLSLIISNAILVTIPLINDDFTNTFIRQIVIIFQILVFDIVFGFMMPFLTLINLRKKIPDFYIQNRRVIKRDPIFYIFKPDFLPREVGIQHLDDNSQIIKGYLLKKESHKKFNNWKLDNVNDTCFLPSVDL